MLHKKQKWKKELSSVQNRAGGKLVEYDIMEAKGNVFPWGVVDSSKAWHWQVITDIIIT